MQQSKAIDHPEASKPMRLVRSRRLDRAMIGLGVNLGTRCLV